MSVVLVFHGRQNGMSASDAAAGAYVECDYRLGTDTLAGRPVRPGPRPQCTCSSHGSSARPGLRITDLEPLVASPSGPGEVEIAGGTVAVTGTILEQFRF